MPETTHDQHTHGHGGHAEAEADRANVGAVGLFIALTAIVLAIASYMLWVYFQRQSELVNYQQVLSQPNTELQALRKHEAEVLGTAGVVNKEQGIYRVPTSVGAQLFLKEAQERKAGGQPQRISQPAAAPAEGAAPAGAPGATPAPAPAAPAAAPQGAGQK